MKEKLKKIIKECGGERVAITLVLFITIFVGMIGLLFGPKESFSPDENRVLEATPQISLESLTNGAFMDSVENYVGDHFPLRKMFISMNCQVQLALGKRDIGGNYSKVPAEGGIYFGKDDHLYEVLLPNRTDTFNINVKGIAQFAQNTGLPLYFIPVPSGSQEQPNKLPAYAPNHDQREELKAIQKSAGSNMKVIDLFETLSEKTGKDYYFKTDHHWNIYGAYEGYRKFTEAMGISATPKEDFNFKTVSDKFFGTLYSKAIYDAQKPDSLILPYYNKLSKVTQQTGKKTKDGIYWENFLTQKDKYAAFLGGNHSVDIVRNANVQNKKKLLIIKDSFANSMVPFLTTNFAEIHIVDLRYYNQNIYEYIRQNNISDIAAIYSIKQLCDVPIGNKLMNRK